MSLAAQALSPAQAATMRPDAAATGICSAHDLGSSQRPSPDKQHAHDCCASACALAGLAAAPPAPVFAAPAGLDATVVRVPSPAAARAPDLALDQPRARGPPSSPPMI
jgi:hypothetical protein